MKLESTKEEMLSKKIESEQRLTSLQSELSDVTSQLQRKTTECDELRRDLDSRGSTEMKERGLAKALEEAEAARRKESERVGEEVQRLEADIEGLQSGE